MKKTALKKDFFREIKGSLNRFLSIVFIVALGVSFYTGIKASEPDMKLNADRLYDDVNFFDIRVLSELGLTDDDIDAIKMLTELQMFKADTLLILSAKSAKSRM